MQMEGAHAGGYALRRSVTWWQGIDMAGHLLSRYLMIETYISVYTYKM
jgi:hypothetical protein